jgi:hypothetical protein
MLKGLLRITLHHEMVGDCLLGGIRYELRSRIPAALTVRPDTLVVIISVRAVISMLWSGSRHLLWARRINRRAKAELGAADATERASGEILRSFKGRKILSNREHG